MTPGRVDLLAADAAAASHQHPSTILARREPLRRSAGLRIGAHARGRTGDVQWQRDEVIALAGHGFAAGGGAISFAPMSWSRRLNSVESAMIVPAALRSLSTASAGNTKLVGS